MSARLQTLAVALVLAALAGPLFLGRGVDLPDDALYSTVSGWEWLRHAILSGKSPFFVPGRLGGVSLYAEATAMGPFYPGFWLALLLPVSLALPLSMALHALGAVLAVRWLARTWGASPLSSTAAGLGALGGTLGLAAFIELQTDVMAIYLWFPVVLGCHRRIEQRQGRARWRWVALGALALGLLLTGSHVRHAAGACGALGLWFLLRWRTLPAAAALTALGLLLGATGVLPPLLEWTAAQDASAEVAALAIPPVQTLRWSALASWLAPKPFVTAREFGLGAVLALGAIFGAREAKPLALWVTLLLLAAAALPGLRWVLAPLTLLAHPTMIVYAALAMIPAAVLGALGLDRLADGARPARWELAVLGVLLLATLVRLTPFGADTFGSPGERSAWILGLGQAALALAAVAWILRSRPAAQRRAALLLLATLELCALGVRAHLAVPSTPLQLASRAQPVPGEEALAGGYAHLGELAVLLTDGLQPEPSLQGALGDAAFDELAEGGEVEDVLAEAPRLQAHLLDRRWPLHLGCARGWRSLSGRAKLAPPRQTAALLPLLRGLLGAPDPWVDEGWRGMDPWGPLSVERLFTPSGLGTRTLALAGIPVATDETGALWPVPIGPRCSSPARVQVEADPDRRLRLLLGPPLPPELAIVEVPLPALVPATVSCEGLTVEVDAPGPALVVLREALHPGWTVGDGAQTLRPLAVDQLSMGVRVPAGRHHLRWRFWPPGLSASLGMAALGLLGVAGLLVGTRRR